MQREGNSRRDIHFAGKQVSHTTMRLYTRINTRTCALCNEKFAVLGFETHTYCNNEQKLNCDKHDLKTDGYFYL